MLHKEGTTAEDWCICAMKFWIQGKKGIKGTHISFFLWISSFGGPRVYLFSDINFCPFLCMWWVPRDARSLRAEKALMGERTAIRGANHETRIRDIWGRRVRIHVTTDGERFASFRGNFVSNWTIKRWYFWVRLRRVKGSYEGCNDNYAIMLVLTKTSSSSKWIFQMELQAITA